jgi:hypothetical protein
MSLQLHRPDGRGGIERRTVRDDGGWRRQLLSARWGSARPDGQLPALRNPEMNPTPAWIAVGFWVGLAALTFVVLLLGYGTGFWN